MTVVELSVRTRPDSRDRDRWSRVAWAVASFGLLLLVWAAGSWVTGLSRPGLVPTPLEVARALRDLSIEPFAGHTLLGHVLSSLTRWGLGFGLALATGALLGLALGTSGVVRAAVNPLFEFLRYIPPFARIPMAVLWMGANQWSAATIVFIAAFPPVVISVQAGVARIDPALLRASRVLGASWPRTLRSVIVPVTMPALFTGARIGVSNGWMAVIAAEMISGTTGVGFLIIQGQENGAVPVVMAGMVAIGLTGLFIDGAVNRTHKHVTRWRKTSGQAG